MNPELWNSTTLPGFDGAVSGSNVAAEMTAVIRFLSWLFEHSEILLDRGWKEVILSFDAGIGCLVGAGDWFCTSEPGLSLALWRNWMLAEEAGFSLHLHWQSKEVGPHKGSNRK